MSTPEKKCRHKEKRRKHINSSVSQCLDCGMLYAMIAGKTSVSRKWVNIDDPRVAFGQAMTEVLLGWNRDPLPRKGDRVRVVFAVDGATCKVGDEVELHEDAEHCSKAAPGCITFVYFTDKQARPVWSGGVKVERVEDRAHASGQHPNCYMCTDPEHPEACPRHCNCVYCVKKRETFERGYQAGLRRAQELVHENADIGDFSVLMFDQNLEAEVGLALVDLVRSNPDVEAKRAKNPQQQRDNNDDLQK